MPFTTTFVLRQRPPGTRVIRYPLALAIVAAATLVRFAADPLIHDQIPYFIYVAAVVVATWFCGIDGGILSTVVSAFAGNFFFVTPRYELAFRAEDWASMGLFGVVAIGLVWLVGRWRRAEGRREEAVEALRQRADELQTILETVPAAVMVTRDRDARRMDGNRFAAEYLHVPAGANLSRTAPADERPETFRVMKDGRELQGDQLPVQMAIARGVEIRDYEFDVVYNDGTARTLFGNVTPLRDSTGQVRGSVGAFIDVTERKRLESEVRRRVHELEARVRQLAESEARYRIMGETLPYGVWLCGPDGGALYASESFLELLNMTREEMQRFSWTDRLMPEDVEPTMKKWLHCVSTGEMWDSEYRIIDRHGEIRTVLTRGLPVRDPDGQITCWVGVNLDITERKRMEIRLRDQSEELAHANRMKDEFLGTLSHELRTPLNAIVGWADMLRRGGLEPDVVGRAVDSIYRNARAQNEMINDVLDVSRIISGKLGMQMQPVDPAGLLVNAVESLQRAADAKGVTVITEFAKVPVPLSGDATRLQQVFWNLLSNAVKFTPSGGHVRVSLRLIDGQIQVQVSDTGIGIAADFLPHVFERFRQHDSSSTRTHSGLGLGLAIVRHLVELHGGSVTAESAGSGQGSTFTVTLPAQPFAERRLSTSREPAVRPGPAVADVPDDLPALCGLRLLVVDDHDDAREVISSVLRHHGAVVACAENAGRAFDEFKRFNPDVLLIDLAMPETDGYALIERIRRSGQTGAATPAIALTAYAREEDQRRALASGFQLHVAKPVDSHTLVRAVASVRLVGGGTATP